MMLDGVCVYVVCGKVCTKVSRGDESLNCHEVVVMGKGMRWTDGWMENEAINQGRERKDEREAEEEKREFSSKERERDIEK